jgi:hypothetical protein
LQGTLPLDWTAVYLKGPWPVEDADIAPNLAQLLCIDRTAHNTPSLLPLV